MKGLLVVSGLAIGLAGCVDGGGGSQKSLSPIPAKTVALMSEKGMTKQDPMLVRIYKKESELEIWKKAAATGQYALLKTYPICRWSGQLGPKVREGDRQAPEGFYSVSPSQMNPNSAYYLSFDTGYPNSFDRAHGRTGSHLMVHGTCSSAGCYAMTDEQIAEVYAIARESFGGGQRAFQLQAFPFRMTPENLAKHRQDPHMAFWKNLKQGSDHFEMTRREPKVTVCAGRYAFNTVGDGCKDDPTLAPQIAAKDEEDRRQVAALVEKGVPALRVVYQDGHGHESFRPGAPRSTSDAGSAFALYEARPVRNLGEVSRPDALAAGPREIAMAEAKGAAAKPGKRDALVGLASSPAPAKPGRTRVASADADETPMAAPAADKPLYERLMGGVFGRETQAAPAAPPAPSAAAEPPKRRGSEARTASVEPSRPKPAGSAVPSPREVDASRRAN